MKLKVLSWACKGVPDLMSIELIWVSCLQKCTMKVSIKIVQFHVKSVPDMATPDQIRLPGNASNWTSQVCESAPRSNRPTLNTELASISIAAYIWLKYIQIWPNQTYSMALFKINTQPQHKCVFQLISNMATRTFIIKDTTSCFPIFKKKRKVTELLDSTNSHRNLKE